MVATCMQKAPFCIRIAGNWLTCMQKSRFCIQLCRFSATCMQKRLFCIRKWIIFKNRKKQENRPVVYRQFFLNFVRNYVKGIIESKEVLRWRMNW